MEDDQEDEELPEAIAEIPQKESDTASAVLKAVEALDAYLPSPTDDLDWFKRVLKGIRAVQRDVTGSKAHWYPWGCPPVERYQVLTSSTDPTLQQYAKSVVQLFQSASS